MNSSHTFKRILFTLAELKVKSLKSREKYYLWKPIFDNLENELSIFGNRYDFKFNNKIIYFNNKPNIFKLLFNFKLNLSILQIYHQLAFEMFLSQFANNKDNSNLEKYKLIKPNITSECEENLYNQFSQILMTLDKFKQAKFSNFETIPVDDYLVNFDVQNTQDFFNKKLAYEVLYQRYSEADHVKLYQSLYSQWIEINALYGEGFHICELNHKAKFIDELFTQVRKNYLKGDILEFCDKLLLKLDFCM